MQTIQNLQENSSLPWELKLLGDILYRYHYDTDWDYKDDISNLSPRDLIFLARSAHVCSVIKKHTHVSDQALQDIIDEFCLAQHTFEKWIKTEDLSSMLEEEKAHWKKLHILVNTASARKLTTLYGEYARKHNLLYHDTSSSTTESERLHDTPPLHHNRKRKAHITVRR